MDLPPLIKLHPELCLASLQTKRDKPLALWYQARALDSKGAGKISYCELINTLSGLGYYSKRTIRRILREGDGSFWAITETYYGRTLYLKSLRRVATLLDVGTLSRRPVQIPFCRFLGRATMRAFFYGIFFRVRGDRGARPISRASIAQATSVNRRQQLRYEARIPLGKQANLVLAQQLPIYSLVESKSRRYWVPRRLGNTYRLMASEAKRGIASSIHMSHENGLQIGGRPTFPRRFFNSVKQFMHYATRDSECFISGVGYQLDKECAQWTILI